MALDQKSLLGEGQATPDSDETTFKRKKLAAHFVDEVSNISIAPNGACRLYFSTWSTDENGQPLRVDSELIMTKTSLEALSKALPRALSQAEAMISNDMERKSDNVN